MPTRVKICGLTSPEEARQAALLGADAIGLVFYPRSPRAVTPEQALEIVAALPPFVTTVALFVDEEPERIEAVLRTVPVDLLQFHGSEPPHFCEQFGRPYLKAIRVREGVDLLAEARRYASAKGLLLDAYHPDLPGGSGRRFDWQLIPEGLEKPVVLAGGLTPENVAEAIQKVRPYGVDVSSGVEREKGRKDYRKMEIFIAEVRRADRLLRRDGL